MWDEITGVKPRRKSAIHLAHLLSIIYLKLNPLSRFQSSNHTSEELSNIREFVEGPVSEYLTKSTIKVIFNL